MKPGTAAKKTTRFSANRSFAGIIFITWLISILACSRSVGEQGGLSATALAQLQTAVVSASPLPKTLIDPPLQPTHTPVPATPTTTSTITQSPTNHVQPSLTPIPTFTRAVATPITDPVSSRPVVLYYTQAGDTLKALAIRFGVKPTEITSPGPIPDPGLFTPNQLLLIPNRLKDIGPEGLILPDSEIVFSPSAINFDVAAFIKSAGGYLSTYKEDLSTGKFTADQVIKRVAIENSISPRLLLAILEYQSHWVYGQPANLASFDYPMGYTNFTTKGLYRQLSWAVRQVSHGYYYWRAGLVTNLTFPMDPVKNTTVRLAPELNAGTVAIQYLFAQLYEKREWGGVLYEQGKSFGDLYQKMFDNPWVRAQTVEPLYPPNLVQPDLKLPFGVGRTWSLTGGPHSAWQELDDGALAALDFAPGSTEHGCVKSDDWVLAPASGLVVRSESGVVTIDLDGDGFEQTGWVIMLLHIATVDRIPAGTQVNVNDRIGHPSCEGGVATGTHTHIARKFNGEWMLADGPVPFNLSGWIVHAGNAPYIGWMTKGDATVTASMVGSFESRITRDDN